MNTTLKSPHGIFYLLDTDSKVDESNPCWKNAACDGVRLREAWPTLQPKSATEFDFSRIDTAIAMGKKYNKQVTLSVVGLAALPVWCKAKTYTLAATDSGHVRTTPNPADPVWLTPWLAFCKKLGATYDGLLDGIMMGGLGVVIESYIADTPDLAVFIPMFGVPGWTKTCQAIIDAHAGVQKQTPFIFTAAVPFSGILNGHNYRTDAEAALTAIIDKNAVAHPGLFGIMNCSQNANSAKYLTDHTRKGYLPTTLGVKYTKTNPSGLQFLCSEGGFGGHTLDGTFAETLTAGNALQIHYDECYKMDLAKPENLAACRAASAKMLK